MYSHAVKIISTNIPPKEIVELGTITWKIDGISRVCLSHLVRHRTFSFSVESLRYVNASNAFVYPTEDNIHLFHNSYANSFSDYLTFTEAYKMQKQMARYVLPLATKTRLVMTTPIKYLAKFFELRLHRSAQQETRWVAANMFRLLMNIDVNDGSKLSAHKLFSKSLDLYTEMKGEAKPK